MRASRRPHFDALMDSMKPGQEILFEQHELEDIFGSDHAASFVAIIGGLDRGNLRDRIMSSLIGSAYGAWSVQQNPSNGRWLICRREPRTDNKRVYVDPDRRHLFDEQPDGTWVRNATPYVKPY